MCLILNDQPSSDLAQVFRVLDGDDQRRTVELLGESLAAGMLGELYRASVIRVADALRDEPLSDIVDEMEPAAAADVLAKLPHDTGGGIMTSRLIAVSEQVTIAEATQHLRSTALYNEDLLAVFVVDADQRLIGVASLRSMLLASMEATMGSIADQEVMRVLRKWTRRRLQLSSPTTIWL